MARNVILTTIGNPSGIALNYYSGMESAHPVFCHSVMPGEACTKYILSQYDIDEIVTIGSNVSCNEGDEIRTMRLDEGVEFITAIQEGMSSYSIFRYRISQFIDDIDLTTTELLEMVEPERYEAINKAIMAIFKTLFKDPDDEIRLKKLFIELANNNNKWDMFVDKLKNKLKVEAFSDIEISIIKGIVYKRLSEKNLMEATRANANTLISFVPVQSTAETGSITNIAKIISKLRGEGNEKVNVYVGIDSDNATDSFTLMSILTTLSKVDASFEVKKVFSTHPNSNGWAYHITDDSITYSIMNLTSGISMFRQYGKADVLVNYLNDVNFKRDKLSNLIYAIRNIDSAISLSDVTELIKGINRLKYVINSLGKNKESDPENEQQDAVIDMIIRAIVLDYGMLITEEELDILELIKWTYNKKLYQQTLTIIESKVPEDILDSGMYFYCNSPNSKDAIIDVLADRLLALRKFEQYKIKEIPHYFIKTYGRDEAPNGKTPKATQYEFANYKVNQIVDGYDALTSSGRIAGHTFCDDKEVLKEAMFSYYNAAIVRNSINHAASDTPEIELIKQEDEDIEKMQLVCETIEYFIKKYEIARNNAINNSVNFNDEEEGGICRISFNQIKYAANEKEKNYHKDNNKSDRDSNGRFFFGKKR